MEYVEKKFLKLKEQAPEMAENDLYKAVTELVEEIIDTDPLLVSVSKVKMGYGTWRSKGFANPYHFGKELADIIASVLSSKITHDEDKEFSVSEFRNDLIDTIKSIVY